MRSLRIRSNRFHLRRRRRPLRQPKRPSLMYFLLRPGGALARSRLAGCVSVTRSRNSMCLHMRMRPMKRMCRLRVEIRYCILLALLQLLLSRRHHRFDQTSSRSKSMTSSRKATLREGCDSLLCYLFLTRVLFLCRTESASEGLPSKRSRHSQLQSPPPVWMDFITYYHRCHVCFHFLLRLLCISSPSTVKFILLIDR